jgi:glycosyltransferase involved in cell wall biosynthesis
MKGVSIIICCYNSGKRIGETLRYVAGQKLQSGLLCEVIVVNNASADDTVARATTAWQSFGKSGISFRIVDEPQAGLMYARKRALDEVKFEIVVFCDDDNHLEPSYVQRAWEIMDAHPEVGIAGGWIKPKLPVYPGKWIEDFYGALAIGKQGAEPGYVRHVYGAGMVVRKGIMKKLTARGIQLSLTGRKGKAQTAGEDYELCLLIPLVGYKVFFSPELVLHHQIAADRLTKKKFIESNRQNFLPTLHLYFLDKIVQNAKGHWATLLMSFFADRTVKVFFFLPRMIIGRHQFYSFINVYSNLLLIFWMPFNLSGIRRSYRTIKKDIGDGDRL